VTYAVVGKKQDTEVDKGSTMMHAMYVAATVGKKVCLKDKATSSSEEIKPIVLCIVELRLAKGINVSRKFS